MSKKECMLSNCCIIVIIFFKKIGILPKKDFYLTTVKYYKQVSFADDRNRKGNSISILKLTILFQNISLSLMSRRSEVLGFIEVVPLSS